jgi:hypothetical protein
MSIARAGTVCLNNLGTVYKAGRILTRWYGASGEAVALSALFNNPMKRCSAPEN